DWCQSRWRPDVRGSDDDSPDDRVHAGELAVGCGPLGCRRHARRPDADGRPGRRQHARAPADLVCGAAVRGARRTNTHVAHPAPTMSSPPGPCTWPEPLSPPTIGNLTPEQLEELKAEAAQILWALTGSRFGPCEITSEPAPACQCRGLRWCVCGGACTLLLE